MHIESKERRYNVGAYSYSVTLPAIDKFEFVFVKFYSSAGCENCRDIAPTWEALGEVVTDTSMLLVDEMMRGALQ